MGIEFNGGVPEELERSEFFFGWYSEDWRRRDAATKITRVFRTYNSKSTIIQKKTARRRFFHAKKRTYLYCGTNELDNSVTFFRLSSERPPFLNSAKTSGYLFSSSIR